MAFPPQLRDELLNETIFLSLDQARQELAAWKDDYNFVRPHSAIGNIAPFEFALLNDPGSNGPGRLSFLGLRAPARCTTQPAWLKWRPGLSLRMDERRGSGHRQLVSRPRSIGPVFAPWAILSGTNTMTSTQQFSPT